MENGKKMITVVGAYMILKGILNLILGFSASNLVSLLFAAVLIFAMLKRIPYSQYVTAIFLALIFLVNLPANLSNLARTGFIWWKACWMSVQLPFWHSIKM